MKLSIVIPVFNERATILEVLRRVHEAPLDPGWQREIIVVDNCSTDGTRELLSSVAPERATILLQASNLGKGSSVRLGIAASTGDYLIVQDADLEYHPREYRRLLLKATTEGLDAVYGSRWLSGSQKHRYACNYWATYFLTALTNVFFGASFTDVATNYKLIRTSLLKSLHLTCSGFDLDFELSNKLAMATSRIGEVAISYSPRSVARGKKVTAIDGVRALRTILRDRLVPQASCSVCSAGDRVGRDVGGRLRGGGGEFRERALTGCVRSLVRRCVGSRFR